MKLPREKAVFRNFVLYAIISISVCCSINYGICSFDLSDLNDLKKKHSEMLKHSKLLPYLKPHELYQFLKNYDKAPPLHYDAVNDLYYSRESERPVTIPAPTTLTVHDKDCNNLPQNNAVIQDDLPDSQ